MADNIFSPEEIAAQNIQPDLPPAGIARREVLAENTDNLAEQMDSMDDVGSIPESVFHENREIQGQIQKGYLDIGLDSPIYKTKWVNYINQNGTKVWEAKAEGWAVGTAEQFPDGAHMLREDNTIRVGDTILMFMRIDNYLKLRKREDEKRLRQQFGLEAEVIELADKYPDALTVHSEQSGGIPDEINKRMKSPAGRVVAKHLGNKMKTAL